MDTSVFDWYLLLLKGTNTARCPLPAIFVRPVHGAESHRWGGCSVLFVHQHIPAQLLGEFSSPCSCQDAFSTSLPHLFPSLVSEAEYSAACTGRLTLGENTFVLVRKQQDTAWNFRAGVIAYRGFVHRNCQCSQTNPPNTWPSWTTANVLIYSERIIVFYKVLVHNE